MDGPDDVFVDALEGFGFCSDVAFVRGFIGGFDVDDDEVFAGLEGLDGVVTFGGVVGIEVAGGSGDVDDVPAEESSDAAEKVDGGDDGGLDAEAFFEGLEGRPAALSPEPDLSCGVFAVGESGLVVGVGREDGLAALHQVEKEVRAFALREVGGDGFFGDIVRRFGFGGCVEGAVVVFAAAVDEEVAVADTFIECPSGIIGDEFLHLGDELCGEGVGDLSCGEAGHRVVEDGDEVAADGPVVRSEFDALCSGFEGGAAGVELEGAVAEEAHGADVAA